MEIGPLPIAGRAYLADSRWTVRMSREGTRIRPQPLWREPMTLHRYPSLLVAALAAAFIGTAAAQTHSDDASRLPAKKGTPQAEQTQPSAQSSDKMKDQNAQMAQSQSGQMGSANQTKDKSAMSSDHSAMAHDHTMSGKKSKSEKNAAGTGTHHQAM